VSSFIKVVNSKSLKLKALNFAIISSIILIDLFLQKTLLRYKR